MSGEVKVMVPGGGNYLKYVQDTIAKQYMEKNPGVTVKVEQEPEGGQLTARIAAGDLPDVYVGVFGYQPAKFAKDKLIVISRTCRELPSCSTVSRLSVLFVLSDAETEYHFNQQP
ncbi:extracellular solute-binding protein [Cohnella pontilimi]|uniref:Extracellular solute-binding protein n=1 Tax=Cohnella pontilimi TaxID=2564100 RepID=A0A4U0F7Y2_9BACL|nr:extracellular solute-binding protein [Cohnella pontilimi]TJY40816.1 extracellular solute-binding protein [Cohnella pontilimi]